GKPCLRRAGNGFIDTAAFQRVANGLEERIAPYRLFDDGLKTPLFEAWGVEPVHGGGYHDKRGISDDAPFTYSLGKRKAVHLGHTIIDKRNIVGNTLLGSAL